MQEARAASKISGTHAAHIYEIGEVEGLQFIAMEYVEGEQLAQRCRTETRSCGGGTDWSANRRSAGVAIMYAGLDKHDQAFASLDKAFDERDSLPVFSKWNQHSIDLAPTLDSSTCFNALAL